MTIRLLIAMSVLAVGALDAHPAGVCDQLKQELDDYNRELLRQQKVREIKKGVGAVSVKVKNVVSDILHGAEKKLTRNKNNGIAAKFTYFNQRAQDVYAYAKNNAGTTTFALGAATVLAYVTYRYVTADNNKENSKEVQK